MFDHPTLRGAFGRMAQEPVFQHSCFQPFIDHPTDDTISDSSVKKRTQVGVRYRPKIVFDVQIVAGFEDPRIVGAMGRQS